MQKSPTRAQERQQIINFFYHHFLVQYKITLTKSYFENRKINFSPWQKKIFSYIFQSFDSLIQKIEPNLGEKWSFNEISNLDKSILLIALAEFFSKVTPRSVAIAEAVKASKIYGTNNSYRFVNKALEKTLIVSENKEILNQ